MYGLHFRCGRDVCVLARRGSNERLLDEVAGLLPAGLDGSDGRGGGLVESCNSVFEGVGFDCNWRRRFFARSGSGSGLGRFGWRGFRSWWGGLLHLLFLRAHRGWSGLSWGRDRSRDLTRLFLFLRLSRAGGRGGLNFLLRAATRPRGAHRHLRLVLLDEIGGEQPIMLVARYVCILSDVPIVAFELGDSDDLADGKGEIVAMLAGVFVDRLDFERRGSHVCGRLIVQHTGHGRGCVLAWLEVADGRRWWREGRSRDVAGGDGRRASAAACSKIRCVLL